jgi:hypothetical protein
MPPRITLVTLGVADVSRARGFYERLGLTASSAGDESVAFFDVNGVVLALFGHDALAEDASLPPSPPPSFRGMSLAWNVASEAEADQVMAHAEACGARIVKPAQKVFWGGYSGYFADPDGHLWEVAYNPYFPFDAQGRIVLP